jgi:hypothetical protein
MLSKEKILDLSTSLRVKNNLPLNDAIELITDYCLIHNKERDKINALLTFCTFNRKLYLYFKLNGERFLPSLGMHDKNSFLFFLHSICGGYALLTSDLLSNSVFSCSYTSSLSLCKCTCIIGV